MIAVTDDVFASRFAVLQDLFNGSISAQEAAENLASISLSTDPEPEGGVTRLWSLIVNCGYTFPGHHDKLVDTLVQLSRLPDAKTASGGLVLLYDMRIWKDLPMLGWQLRDEWNISVPTGPSDHRQSQILKIINRDKFTALLMATEEAVFRYSWFALVTLRNALETPADQLSPVNPLEALIPAAAAWISTLGVEIYEWDEDFNGHAGSAPGRGGPLWKGKHGFCKGQMAALEGEIWRVG
ncbi:Protein of unknown function DUF3632 [Penicillium atrosanguineum]|nr:Protein of unknown function DUF3632 [Penicillium atrosanguineum]